jgi:hypothetical protein
LSEENFRDERDSERARNSTLSQSNDKLKEKVRTVLETFGAREKSDGSFEIDYDAFVERLGIDGALAVRKVIDERYKVSGAAGEKPRVRAKANAA